MLIVVSIIAAFLAGAVAVLAVAFASMHRRHSPRFSVPPALGTERDFSGVAALTHGTLTEGNRVTLVLDEAYLEAFIALADGARETLHVETFLWKTGEMSRAVADALAAAARRGVVVRVLVDALGSREMEDEERARLVAAGVQLHRLRPPSMRSLGWLNNRTHRKILVADGRVAIIGGHCIDDRWIGGAGQHPPVRDVSVHVEGPVVRTIQSAFSENWIEVSGTIPHGPGVFPPLPPAGSASAHLAYVRPSGGVSSVKVLHHLALRMASERLWIQSPYFVPNDRARVALIDAVARGVDVRILTNGVRSTDNRLVAHASHHRLAPLLERGVRVYHYQRTFLHQKVWSVDGDYALIGSTNFDDRSFDLDDQVTLGVLDPDLLELIDERFLEDLRHATPVDPSFWKHRPAHQKVGDALAFVLREHL